MHYSTKLRHESKYRRGNKDKQGEANSMGETQDFLAGGEHRASWFAAAAQIGADAGCDLSYRWREVEFTLVSQIESLGKNCNGKTRKDRIHIGMIDC